MKKTTYPRETMLTIRQFANLLGISRRHAYNLVDKGAESGGIMAFRFGGRNGLRIPETEATRFKKENTVDNRR